MNINLPRGAGASFHLKTTAPKKFSFGDELPNMPYNTLVTVAKYSGGILQKYLMLSHDEKWNKNEVLTLESGNQEIMMWAFLEPALVPVMASNPHDIPLMFGSYAGSYKDFNSLRAARLVINFTCIG